MDDQKSAGQDNTQSFQLPQKAFFTLADACSCKGLNYKTACNKRSLQPNRGIADGKLGGRKVWRYTTIAVWVTQLDDELSDEGAEEVQAERIGLVQTVMAKKKKAS